MNNEIFSWESKNLGYNAEINVYGHFGVSFLLFPFESDDCYESEVNGLIDALSSELEHGKCKIYCLRGINYESWFNPDISNEEKSKKHHNYNNYIVDEVVPFVFNNCGSPVPIITCGAKHGAFHAANTYFRRPDIFLGMLAVSGIYDIRAYTGDYFDDNCYFNSPVDYLPNLNENYWLSFLRNRHHVYLVSGSGENEHPEHAVALSEILTAKDIPHVTDIWGPDFGHNSNTWITVIKHYIRKKI
ncbi:MAG: esterase [Candidatus Kapaibacterium sp.]